MGQFTVSVTHLDGFRFEMEYGHPPPITTDLSAPLGTETGPNPEHLLGASVANCLAATLLFSLNKMKVPVQGLKASATGNVERGAGGRLRIVALKVLLELTSSGDADDIARANAIFRDYCTVSRSIEAGIPVESELIVKTT